MPISPLIPAAGAAGIFAARAAKSLAGGVSFADVFRKADAAQPSPAQPAADQASVPASGNSGTGADPQKLLGDFQSLLAKKLTAAGIDLSKPIELHATGDDNVQVNSENPDWPRIEQLLSGDPELKDAFHRLADAFSPGGAANRGQFKLTLAGGQATVSLE